MGRAASSARRAALRAPCLAPYANLYLGPQGEVRACCANSNYLGNIRVQRLTEIWDGVQQRELRRRLREGDFSHGCSYCAWEKDQGIAMYARVYDTLRVRSAAPPFPTRIEFALTNACNLQCTMCNGENSSAIRIHREGRRPSPPAYGDEFFDDLATFIPHLDGASFVGGEPFLGAENFRAWDLFAEHNPGAEIGITTNGTQWSKRVEQVLETLAPGVTVSIDGMTKGTFESIRQGADFETVLTNLDRFVEYGRRSGKRVNISHCLMPDNYEEFGDLLLHAEERDVHVHVAVVTTPASQSLERLSRDQLHVVAASLDEQARRVLPRLGAHNAGVLEAQIRRIEVALAADGSVAPAPEIDAETIVGFPRRREGGEHGADEQVAVAADGSQIDGVVGTLEVGANDIVLDCSPALAAWLEIEPAELIGVHLGHLDSAVHRRFGALSGDRRRTIETDVVERTFRAGDTAVRSVAVPLRDEAGWIRHVTVTVSETLPP
ncbi:MAG: radical SAM protein [Acidimicrobiales bacterium]|nr:radical SAM protein [Acidimicrobiales bacterium]